jgi:hypothetical protein
VIETREGENIFDPFDIRNLPTKQGQRREPRFLGMCMPSMLQYLVLTSVPYKMRDNRDEQNILLPSKAGRLLL